MDNSNTQSSRYAVYVRFATNSARESSITEQVNTCIAAAANINPALTLADNCVLTDAGVSGTSVEGRPGLSALIEAAAQQPRPFDYVLMTDTARLSRSIGDALRITGILMNCGVALHFVSESLCSTDENFQGIFCLFGAMDHQFNRTLSDMVRRGMEKRADSGFSTGGRCFGYTTHLDLAGSSTRMAEVGMRKAVVESEAAVIRRIYSEFASGVTAPKIARTLNAEGVVGPCIRDADRHKPFPWTARLIYSVLRRQTYRGTMQWGRTQKVHHPKTGKIEARHQPESAVVCVETPHLMIVSPEIAKAVDDRLAEMSGEDGAGS
ncbi:MAG: recombinase family protein [Terracidiphilus sp.]